MIIHSVNLNIGDNLLIAVCVGIVAYVIDRWWEYASLRRRDR